jgi:hypothetical protein
MNISRRGAKAQRNTKEEIKEKREERKMGVFTFISLPSSFFPLRALRLCVRSFVFIVLVCGAGFAQDRSADAFMVPQTVYVGDRAALILLLPGFAVKEDFENASVLSPSADIEIHRALLEQRPVGSRLTVEFTAYAPGVLELPSIVIAGEVFSGLKIEISSILESGSAGKVLSGPALPLAIPGTSLLVYGTLISILCCLSIAFWVLFWGRKRIKGWLAAWEKKRLLAGMAGIEKRLRKTLAKGDDTYRNILDTLSREFRLFLSRFTGESCQAMTASEFNNIESRLNGEFLKDFFRRCDGIRFSGGEIKKNDAMSMLDDLKQFLAALAASALTSAPLTSAPLTSAPVQEIVR